MKPLIGITSDYQRNEDIFKCPAYFISENYIMAVKEAGGIPIIMPYISDNTVVEELLERIDGLLITGGNFDINPEFYGEMPIEELGKFNEKRTAFEMEITKAALKADKPIFGICGGEQLLNVATGGSLFQDIETQVKKAQSHQQTAAKSEVYHPVHIQPSTKLYSILGCNTIKTNSTHHQSIKKIGRNLTINAIAEDGIIEGIESIDHTFILGVQWHPEYLYKKEKPFERLFKAFVQSCKTSPK
ncbi:MAG: gamma-glutamyl-gamma-aminobutyrate hydrolase family protein [Thermodesulfobacteriota bacterium]|nr:gamma-glutamyl-gamma-aminobutyrate hydrolase family protein [Thermodesulfobacteriota bacterium]